MTTGEKIAALRKENPMVGSSRYKIGGSCSRESATSAFILCPRLSCLTGVWQKSCICSISTNQHAGEGVGHRGYGQEYL